MGLLRPAPRWGGGGAPRPAAAAAILAAQSSSWTEARWPKTEPPGMGGAPRRWTAPDVAADNCCLLDMEGKEVVRAKTPARVIG